MKPTTTGPERRRSTVTTKTGKLIHVTRDQVSAARALIELRGAIEHVDTLTAKIAAATPRSLHVVPS